MRIPHVALVPTLVAVALPSVMLSGCGPSELKTSYRAYVDQVEPLLEQEDERWTRIVGMIRKRQDNAALPRYYKYVSETALPYYTKFKAAVDAVPVGNERLNDVHEQLVRFADARLAFLHLEARGHEVYQRATADDSLIQVQSMVQDAEALRIAYLKSIGDGVPDAKFGELHQIIDPFAKRYFQPMQQQMKDPDEVQLRLRSHVIPALKAIQARKFKDDESAKLLRECVAKWLAWHELLERTCPLLQEVMQAKTASEQAAQEAEDALAEFKKELGKVQLEY